MTLPGFSNLQIANDCCFLCGAQTADVTQEHVFPKWLQSRHNLWTQRVGLLNDTQIQYRNLLIPCCMNCNNEDLSRLESAVSSAIASGYAASTALDPRLIYLWAGKVFYGILRKEIGLLRDRSRPNDGSIFLPKALVSFSNLHLFLQGIRGNHLFEGDPPYSVLVCNLHDLGSPRNYCFGDNIAYMTVAIRMGEVGIIVALEDAGMTKQSYGRYVTKVNGQKLHPIQFDELYAKVTYQSSLVEGRVNYLTSQHVDGRHPAKTEVFDQRYIHEWSQEHFSVVLRTHVGKWLRSKGEGIQWFVPPHSVPTWMVDQSGELLLRSAGDWELKDALDA